MSKKDTLATEVQTKFQTLFWWGQGRSRVTGRGGGWGGGGGVKEEVSCANIRLK